MRACKEESVGKRDGMGTMEVRLKEYEMASSGGRVVGGVTAAADGAEYSVWMNIFEGVAGREERRRRNKTC